MARVLATAATTTAKTLVGKTDVQIAALREIKRLASQRCIARRKALAKGEVPGAELALRSAQSSVSLDRMKVTLADGTIVSMHKAGEKIRVRQTATDGTSSSATYDTLKLAFKAYRELTGATQA